MTVRRWALPVLAVAGLLALGGCSLWGVEGGPGGIGAARATASTGPTPVDATAGPDGVQRIDITMGDDLRLHPSLVRAHPGLIEFTFHNNGSTPHDIEFQLPAGQSGTGNLNAGAAATVRVRVDQPGSYPFPCLYHQSSGMQGTLVVTAVSASG
jgi:plastocyanin